MRTLFLAIGIAAGLAARPAADAASPVMQPLAKLLQPGSAEAAPASCAPISVNIYFQRDNPSLTGAAQTTLDVIGERMRGCAIAAVAIETPADSVATPEGRKLAGLRGAALLKGLSARGLTPDAVVIGEQADREPASADPTPQHVRLSLAVAPQSRRNAAHEDSPRPIAGNEI